MTASSGGSSGGRGLEVSRLGLGLAAIGRPGYITLGRARDLPARAQPGRACTRAAPRCSTRHAPPASATSTPRAATGGPRSSSAAGSRERGVARDAVTVGSKWGYRYTAGWTVDAPVHEQKELSVGTLPDASSRRRARCSAIGLDLYQIHSATAESGALGDARAARRARRGATRAARSAPSGSR